MGAALININEAINQEWSMNFVDGIRQRSDIIKINDEPQGK